MLIIHMCLTDRFQGYLDEMKCQGISKNNGGHGNHRVPSRGSQFGICKVCGVSSFISASVPSGTSARCLFKAVSTPRINFPTSRRNASRLLYRISLQLTPPRRFRAPRAHHRRELRIAK